MGSSDGSQSNSSNKRKKSNIDIPTARQLWSWLKVIKLSAGLAMVDGPRRLELPPRKCGQ